MKDCLGGGQNTMHSQIQQDNSSFLSLYTFNQRGARGVGRREGDRSRGRHRERELRASQCECPSRESMWKDTGGGKDPVRFPPPQPAPSFPHASDARSTAHTSYHLWVMKRRIFVCNTAPKCQPISSFRESPRETRVCFNGRRQIAVRQLKRCSQISSDHVGFLSVLSLWSEGEHFTPGWSQTMGGRGGVKCISTKPLPLKRPKPLRQPLWELQDHKYLYYKCRLFTLRMDRINHIIHHVFFPVFAFNKCGVKATTHI